MKISLLNAIVSAIFILSLSACVKQKETVVPVRAKTSSSADDASLLDTYWKLLELRGNAVVTPKGMREAHFILASSESRTHGFSGCNNFFGSYKYDSNSLSFSALGSTRMACAEGMDTEQAFLKTLGETTRLTIKGQFMELYAEDILLARFEAMYL
jgi:heat shock protein HslJ